MKNSNNVTTQGFHTITYWAKKYSRKSKLNLNYVGYGINRKKGNDEKNIRWHVARQYR
jgi:hypothetical protein